MKRLLALLPALVAALALASCGAKSGSTTYTADGAFTFTIPAGFTGVAQGGETYPLFVNDPSNFTAYMQLASDDYQGDLQRFVDEEVHGFQGSSEMTNVTVTASGEVTTESGAKGIRVLMTFGSQKGSMEMAAYYFQKPGQVQVLHGICYAAEASHFLPLFDDSAGSVVLK